MPGRRGNSVGPTSHDQSDLNPFPLGFALSVSLSAISVFLVIPMIAYVVPARDRTDFVWWNQAVICRSRASNIKQINNVLEGFSDVADALWISDLDDAVTGIQSSNGRQVLDRVRGIGEKLHAIGVKLLIDFPAGYTSNTHPWFQHSQQADSVYKDHYVWEDGKKSTDGKRIPPNNWISEVGGSAWQWDEKRQQYYLHQKDEKKPDLNHRNSHLQKDLADILIDWAAAGVDGFVIRDAHSLVESHHLKDEPLSYMQDTSPGDHGFFRHIHTQHQSENHDVISVWRHVLDSAGHNTTFLLAEMDVYIDTSDNTGNKTNWSSYYTGGSDLVVNPSLLKAEDNECDPGCLAQAIEHGMEMVPEKQWPNWILPRLCTKNILSPWDRVMMSLGLLLPGSVVIEDKNECRDEVKSFLQRVRAVREIPAFKWGGYDPVLGDDQVVAYLRHALGKLYERYLIVANFGEKPVYRNLNVKILKIQIPVNGTLVFSTNTETALGHPVPINNLKLEPQQAVVVKFSSGAI